MPPPAWRGCPPQWAGVEWTSQSILLCLNEWYFLNSPIFSQQTHLFLYRVIATPGLRATPSDLGGGKGICPSAGTTHPRDCHTSVRAGSQSSRFEKHLDKCKYFTGLKPLGVATPVCATLRNDMLFRGDCTAMTFRCNPCISQRIMVSYPGNTQRRRGYVRHWFCETPGGVQIFDAV